MTARVDNEWIRCGKCGHKLGRMVGIWPTVHSMPALEIKCHSCKENNYIMIGGTKGRYESNTIRQSR